MDELNKLNESTIFRRYMTEEEDQRKIYNSRMKSAEKKGLEQGIKEGKAEEKISISKNLLDKNIDIEIISSSTGLSIEKIEKLK